VPIELVIFDIAGTLIEDHDEVTLAFHAAFLENGIEVTREELREWKGGAKREVIRRFVDAQAQGAGEELVEKTFADFRRILETEYVKSLKPIAGAEEAMRSLRQRGLKTATITGFYRELRDTILSRLGWRELFDAHISSDDVPRGRPAPYLVFRAMEAAGVADVRKVMVVGDTPLDLQAATNAGTVAVGVLTGVHPKSRLKREPHAHIVASVAEVPKLLSTYS
jgi:phosphoglycolate phosphatase